MKYLKKFNESDSTEESREIRRLQDESLKRSSENALAGKTWLETIKEYLEKEGINPKELKSSEILNILKTLNVPSNIIYTTLEEVRNL